MKQKMRTQEEILKRYEVRKKNDFLGFETEMYLMYLDYNHAKTYLKEGTKPEDWKEETMTPEEQIKDYMEFAWDKANNCRGISAGRSISHLIAWIWLSGDDYFANEVDEDYKNNYEHYGKEILIKICDHYGIDWKQHDDGVRTNFDQ